MKIGDWILGKPLSSYEDENERLGSFAAVGVLGLDALASAAYGPEALLTVLIPLGAGGLRSLLPLIGAIVVLLIVLGLSYRQTIAAYPGGGGAYTVAKENLGESAGLLTAAALALDYLLNAAVAVSAGVGALVSAIPSLLPHSLGVGLAVLLLLALLNLRGVRSTGAVFLLPTYAFVVSLAAVIGVGIFKAVAGGGSLAAEAPAVQHASVAAPSLWLLLRAFANGCTAMTGVEAVSNGVPLFKEPTVRNARRTLGMIVAMLVVLLIGIAVLCRLYGITATPPGRDGYESVLSQVIAAAVGRGPLYYVSIASVVAVLTLSANTSFADFPRVCRLLASDRFLPEPFLHRGRRLVFSYGIIVLAVSAAILLIIFGGITEGLIPLFAVGALAAFTMSQLGMVAHFRREATPRARRAALMNFAGAFATGATLIVVIASKFREGAYISLALVGGMLLLFRQVRRHYDFIAAATATDVSLDAHAKSPCAVVPLRRWDAVALKALRFAVGTTQDIVAVQVLTDDREVEDLSGRWEQLVAPLAAAGAPRPRLVVLRSEYRQLLQPLVSFVIDLAKREPEREVAVIVPELIEARWYYRLLHNQTASVMRAMLLFRGGPQIAIITIPWYLRDWIPERQRLRRAQRDQGWRFSRHGPSTSARINTRT